MDALRYQTIDLPDTTLSYIDTGPPRSGQTAETVLFGHGLLFGGWMFTHQIRLLRSRCVAPDWRGQGNSVCTPASRRFDMDTLATDTLALIEALDTGPAHFVGLSMGGYVGLRLAIRHPAHLRSLALLNSMARAETRRATVEYTALAWFQRFCGLDMVRPALEAKLFGPEFPASPQGCAVTESWFARIADTDRGILRSVVAGITSRDDVHSDLGRITVPTLVVTAEHDVPTPPAEGLRMANAIPDARLRHIAGSGHSSALERPDEVAGHLVEHLDALSRRTPPSTPGLAR